MAALLAMKARVVSVLDKYDGDICFKSIWIFNHVSQDTVSSFFALFAPGTEVDAEVSKVFSERWTCSVSSVLEGLGFVHCA